LFFALIVGFLVDFISYPVINSFTTAAAITIAFGQVKVSSTCISSSKPNKWVMLLGNILRHVILYQAVWENFEGNDILQKAFIGRLQLTEEFIA